MTTTTRPPEATLALLRHGYAWSDHIRAARPDPDAVEVRMLGRPAVVLRGPSGVRTFTDGDLVRRRGAIPGPVADVLFGRGAVHGLDDVEHRRRKALFVEATRAPAVADLVFEVECRWLAASRHWAPGDEVVVEREAVRALGRAVLAWSGVRTTPRDADRVAERLAAIVDGFAVPGAPYLRARWSRRRSDAWAVDVVRRARRRDPAAPSGSALELVAWWCDEHGRLLPPHVAAVELQNLLRPTVAVSRLVAFGARQLVLHAGWRARLRAERTGRGPGAAPGPVALAFAQEVRRWSPFVPVLAGVTRRPLAVNGRELPAGSRLLLDVVGTLHDDRYWPEPRRFDPGRFLGGQEIVRDALVPQGGGEVATGHRCPGEDITLGVLAESCGVLSTFDWLVPPQDLAIPVRRLPTRPSSGVRLAVVRTPAMVRARAREEGGVVTR